MFAECVQICGTGPSPVDMRGDRIRVIKSPNFPQFRFEWHTGVRKVYLVRVGQIPEIGEVFAHNIDTDGQAHNAVLIWLRGYRAAQGHIWNDAGKLVERRDVA